MKEFMVGEKVKVTFKYGNWRAKELEGEITYNDGYKIILDGTYYLTETCIAGISRIDRIE